MRSPHVERCALLFGTPVDWDEFAARSKALPPSDYLIHVLRDEEPEIVWNKYYEPVATAALRLIDTAENLGASVRRKATLNDLSNVSLRHDRLILMAHWRGAIVSIADLQAAPEEIVQFIHAHTNPLVEVFADTPATVADIVEALNKNIQNRTLVQFLPQSLALAAQESAALGRTLCRDLIDETFDGLLVPGNRLELFDGLHTLGSIEQALQDSFRGELELATCNSEALATYLDLRRGNRIRHLHWADLINPIPQFALIAESLKRLAVSGGSYIDIRLRVEDEL